MGEILAGIIRTLMKRMWKILALQTYTDRSAPAAQFPIQCSKKSVSVRQRNKNNRTVRCAGCPRLPYLVGVITKSKKSKGVPREAEVAQRVPGRLRPRIILTFGTTRLVGRQPYAPTAFIPRRNPWYSF